jgi:hypothetical protein
MKTRVPDALFFPFKTGVACFVIVFYNKRVLLYGNIAVFVTLLAEAG